MIRTVAYIPLDDRPCNLDRVVMAGEAMGLNVLTPNKNYIHTCLDNQPMNSTGMQTGSPYDIIDWLRDVTAQNNIQGYIISLDQIMSGGLVGSRISFGTGGTNITNEMARLETIMGIVGTTPVYFFDTVMRLASTVQFQGYTSPEYTATRNYGSLPRKLIYDNFYEIMNGYKLDRNGNIITDTCGLSYDQVDDYISSRQRKFTLNVEAIKYIKTFTNTYVVVGVDDSKNPDTIQKNEITYLEDNVIGKGGVFAGADELGMCMLSRFTVEQLTPYGQGRLPKIKVRYFGGGENKQADGFDYRTLDFGVNIHIGICGGERVSSGHDIELLVLTQPNTGTYSGNANDLHYELNLNNTNNMPTIVIDASLNKGELQRRLYGLVGSTNTAKLLAYSGWGTAGNMIGLALGHGIGRFAFITTERDTTLTRKALTGQVKILFTELVKEISYQMGAKGCIDNYLKDFVDKESSVKLTDTERTELPYNFYKYDVDQENTWKWGTNCLLWSSFDYMTRGEFSIHNIAKVFWTEGTNHVYETFTSPSSCQISRINWINYPYENGDSSWFKLEYPWHRTYECQFPLGVSFK